VTINKLGKILTKTYLFVVIHISSYQSAYLKQNLKRVYFFLIRKSSNRGSEVQDMNLFAVFPLKKMGKAVTS
jgi:hypothetical protein